VYTYCEFEYNKRNLLFQTLNCRLAFMPSEELFLSSLFILNFLTKLAGLVLTD
jgi:hypothetical protein